MYLVALHGHATSSWPGSSGAPTECRAGTKSSPAGPSNSGSTAAPIRVMIFIEATTYSESVISTPSIGFSAVGRAHAERDDVHGPAAHAPAVQLGHHRLHLGRLHQLLVTPASDSSSEQMKVRSSTRATSSGSEAAQKEFGFAVEPDERARLDEAGRHPVPLLLGPVAPHDPLRRGQLRHLAHPGQQARVLGRGVVDPWHGRCGHLGLPPTWPGADPTSGTLTPPAPGRAGEPVG